MVPEVDKRRGLKNFFNLRKVSSTVFDSKLQRLCHFCANDRAIVSKGWSVITIQWKQRSHETPDSWYNGRRYNGNVLEVLHTQMPEALHNIDIGIRKPATACASASSPSLVLSYRNELYKSSGYLQLTTYITWSEL